MDAWSGLGAGGPFASTYCASCVAVDRGTQSQGEANRIAGSARPGALGRVYRRGGVRRGGGTSAEYADGHGLLRGTGGSAGSSGRWRSRRTGLSSADTRVDAARGFDGRARVGKWGGGAVDRCRLAGAAAEARQLGGRRVWH